MLGTVDAFMPSGRVNQPNSQFE